MPTRRAILTGAAGALALGTGGTALHFRQEADRYANYAAGLRLPLQDDAGVGELIRYACLAPNSHNTQAWQFVMNGNRVDIRPDFSRRTPIVDPDDHHLYVSLGCALENLLLAAESRGLSGEVGLLDDGRAGCLSRSAVAAPPWTRWNRLCSTLSRNASRLGRSTPERRWRQISSRRSAVCRGSTVFGCPC